MSESLEHRGRLPMRAEVEAAREGWRDVDERGTVAGIRALIVTATALGRPFARFITRFVAAYYTLASPTARRSVATFRRHLGERPSLAATYRTIRHFADCSLDALFFMRGRTELFDVDRNGTEHLREHKEKRDGAILLGAHFGSFYAMRAFSSQESFPLHPLVYTKNARRFNAVIESLDPSSTTRLIEIGEGGQIDFMLHVRERLEEGALVAVLGDRPQPGGKNVEVDFLGGRALLPAGPYILAASLRRPVYFVAGVYLGGNRYKLRCLPFAEQIVLPRRRRQEAIAEYAQKYADLLAQFAREHPDNWFNFFDFFQGDAPDGDRP